jgi:hypothetical protein
MLKKKLSRARMALVLGVLVLALSSCTTEQIIWNAFADKGATPAQQQQAVEVARCESGLNPAAVSPGGGNWGLFQINRVHAGRVNAMGFNWSDMTHSWENAQVAAELWSQAGWSPWSCARRLGY